MTATERNALITRLDSMRVEAADRPRSAARETWDVGFNDALDEVKDVLLAMDGEAETSPTLARRPRPLGSTQQGILRALRTHGQWYGGGFGCGWQWGSESQTRGVLDTLVKRGLAAKTVATVGKRENVTVYHPTAVQS